MKVYVVTSGTYSDYCIEAIFSDKKKAEVYSGIHSYNEVEEWEVDEVDVNVNTEIISYAIVYYKPFDQNPISTIAIERGEKVAVEALCSVKITLKGKGYEKFYVRADSIAKARKIFCDEYAKAMYEYYMTVEGE